MRARGRWIAALCLAAVMADPAAFAAERPKIGLVLGGGGARGAAHVGVLKVLEELRVPVDFVVGTSMGAIVGGLFASGMSPAQIETELRALDWDDLLDDDPPRPERSFRRKRDDDLYLVKRKPGYREGKIRLPLAAIQGQKLELALSRLTLPVATTRNFGQLSIPFRAVTTDIATGDAVILGAGDLAQALRASMAVPGIFAPVEIDGRLLIDGGVTNNLPVDVARAMGADILIVVDISTPLRRRDQLDSALAVLDQMTGFLTRRSADAQRQHMHADDVLIVPDLNAIAFGDFERIGEAIPRGYVAADAAQEQLRRLSLSPHAYEAYLAQQRRHTPEPPVIDFVRIDNRSRVGDEVIAARLHTQLGAALDVHQLESDIGHIYGLDIFENVRYEIVTHEQQTGLVVHAQEKRWGPNYLQFGLAFSDNFAGDNKFGLSAAYLRPALNARAGELRVAAQIGEEPALLAEFHQPLDPASRYFAEARATYSKQNINAFGIDSNILAEYRVTQTGLELSAGREFGTWGEARLGYQWLWGNAHVRVGDPSIPDEDFEEGALSLRMYRDTMDDLNFPRHGALDRLQWRSARKSLGSDQDFDQLLLDYTIAKTWGRSTVLGIVRYYTTPGDDAPVSARFRTGGFTKLSGFQEDELSGQHVGILGLGYSRRIADIQWFPAYAGGSFEIGNAWQKKSEVGLDNVIYAGSLWVGVDTPVGPAYLAFGHAEGTHNNFYLFLGRLF